MVTCFVLSLVFLTGCGQSATTESTVPGTLPSGGEVLEESDGLQITRAMVDIYLGAMPAEAQEKLAAPDQMKRLQTEIVREEKLFRAAVERSLHEDPTVEKQLLLAQRQVLFQALLKQVVEEKSTEESVQAW